MKRQALFARIKIFFEKCIIYIFEATFYFFTCTMEKNSWDKRGLKKSFDKGGQLSVLQEGDLDFALQEGGNDTFPPLPTYGYTRPVRARRYDTTRTDSVRRPSCGMDMNEERKKI